MYYWINRWIDFSWILIESSIWCDKLLGNCDYRNDWSIDFDFNSKIRK